MPTLAGPICVSDLIPLTLVFSNYMFAINLVQTLRLLRLFLSFGFMTNKLNFAETTLSSHMLGAFFFLGGGVEAIYMLGARVNQGSQAKDIPYTSILFMFLYTYRYSVSISPLCLLLTTKKELNYT